MRSRACAIAARTAAAAATCIISTAFTLGGAQAQTAPYVMKITTPTIHAAPDMYARNFAAAVEKDSGGRIKAQVYPASQLGSIPRQIEGTQFGSIQGAVIPPEFFVGVDQRFEVLAAPGLVSSVAQSQRVAADPAVLKAMLGARRRQGSARRRVVFRRTRGGGVQDADPSSGRFQRQEAPDFCVASFSPWPSSGSALRRSPCRRATCCRRSSRARSTAPHLAFNSCRDCISMTAPNTSP